MNAESQPRRASPAGVSIGRIGALRMRSDLVHDQVWMGHQRVWVVKDPLASEFVYLSDQEHAILSLADGHRSLSEIIAEISRRFAPEYFSSEAILSYFAVAHKKRLLVTGSLARTHETSSHARLRLRNFLAIRLPGIHPDRILGKIDTWMKPILSPAWLIVAGFIVISAMMLGIVHFRELVEHLAVASETLTLQHLGLVIVLISFTKIVHEMAHAIACRRLGGDCREIGVLLLVGIPCLYCDVSDAWMMRDRWRRVLVSAAGMMAEVFMASIAMFVWLASVDGPLRDGCVVVISICSLSTLVLNGNPLMRYDGYYIASDLVGIPNLAAQSTELVRSSLRCGLWGIPAGSLATHSIPLRRVIGLVAYAIASFAYRIFLYAAILGWMYVVAEARGFGGIMVGVVLLSIVMAVSRWLQAIIRPPSVGERRMIFAPRRPMYVAAAILSAPIVIGLIPFSRTVVAPLTIDAGEAVVIYVSTPGTLVECLQDGDDVAAGDIIARLVNDERDREFVAVRGEMARLQVQLAALQSERAIDKTISLMIPAAEKRLAETLHRLELLQRERERTRIRAPRTGRIFDIRTEPKSPLDLSHGVDENHPMLDAKNVGAYARTSTRLCKVGDAKRRDAILAIRQQDIELVRENQIVTLALAGWPTSALTGRVRDIARSPMDDHLTDTPRYRVRVELDEAAQGMPINLSGSAQVKVAPQSLWGRFRRFTADSFAPFTGVGG